MFTDRAFIKGRNLLTPATAEYVWWVFDVFDNLPVTYTIHTQSKLPLQPLS